MTELLFDKYAPIIKKLNLDELKDIESLPVSLEMDRDGDISSFYIPFEYVPFSYTLLYKFVRLSCFD